MRKAILLVALACFAACGAPDTPEPVADHTPVLPGPGQSYVIGPRDAPESGRIAVGLLIKRPTPRRLADMVPPEALERFLAEEKRRAAGEEIGPEPIEEVWEADWIDPIYHPWGRRGAELAAVARDLRDRHDLEIVYREILAHECGDYPIVLVARGDVETEEEADLARYESAGGIVLRAASIALGPIRAQLAEVLTGAALSSPLVHHVEADPFVVDATRVGDDLRLAYAGEVEVSLHDLADQVVAEGRADGDAVLLSAPDPELDPFQHYVVATWKKDDLVLERRATVEELVGTPERLVETSVATQVGSALALRIHTTNSQTRAPVEGESGVVSLGRGETVVASLPYTTDAMGYAEVVLPIPSDTASDSVELRVANQIVGAIHLRTDTRISLVTERTLYKEDDTIHTRVMVHRAGDGRPVADAEVTLKFGDTRKKVTTSEHGIASADFTLLGESVGKKKLEATCQGATATAAFRVKAFERPTFLVSIDKPTLVLRKGESAPVTLVARYVNEKPMVGAKVEIEDSTQVEVRPFQGETGPDGTLAFTLRATSNQRGFLRLKVTDADGRIQRADVNVRSPSRAKPAVWALGDPIAGVPVTLAVLAPGTDAVTVTGSNELAVDVDLDQGYGEFEITPSGEAIRVQVDGTSVTIPLGSFDGKRPLIALTRRIASVGATLDGTVLSSDGRVLLEIERDDALVYMSHVDVANGRGTFAIPIAPSMAGAVDIRVHRAEDTTRDGTHAQAIITRGRALDIGMVPDQAYYKAGETAAVEVTVKDAKGAPTAAVLGYWGVDQALLALADFGEGNEDVFDVLAAKPNDEFAYISRVATRETGAPSNPRQVLGAVRPSLRKQYAVSSLRTPVLGQQSAQAAATLQNQRFSALWNAYLEAWKEIPFTEINYAWSMRGVLEDLVRGSYLDADLLVDAWGTPLVLWHDVRGLWYDWMSAGPDRTFGTEDDRQTTWDGTALYWSLPQRILRFHRFIQKHRVADNVEDKEEVFEEDTEVADEPFVTDADMPFEESFGMAEGLTDAPFEGPSSNGTIGIGGGMGGAFRGRGGGRDIRKSKWTPAAIPIHVRKDFDPTLCFVPEVIVGPDGKSRLDIPLKDSITTWKMRLVASRADGASGVGFGEIKVGQPLYATPWLATHLTVGDTLDLPVAVRNEQPIAIEAAVRIKTSPSLEILGQKNALVSVRAGGTAAHVFQLRAVARGTATVRIEVQDGEHIDIQERIVKVRPYARDVVMVKNATLTPATILSGALELEGAGDVRMDLYPTPLADTLSGFEGLIRCPHG